MPHSELQAVRMLPKGQVPRMSRSAGQQGFCPWSPGATAGTEAVLNVEAASQRDVSRESGAQARWQETKHPVKQGPGQRKAVTSRPTANHTAEGDSVLEADKVGTGRGLQPPNVSFCSLYPHYSDISLTDMKYHQCQDQLRCKSLYPSGR